MGGSSAATYKQLEMLRICRLKSFPQIVLVKKMSVSLYQMGW